MLGDRQPDSGESKHVEGRPWRHPQPTRMLILDADPVVMQRRAGSRVVLFLHDGNARRRPIRMQPRDGNGRAG